MPFNSRIQFNYNKRLDEWLSCELNQIETVIPKHMYICGFQPHIAIVIAISQAWLL